MTTLPKKMALTSSYLTSTKNLESFLNALTTAQAPEIFTQRILENLEFKSSSDRLLIGLLKALGLLDDTSKPTDRYYRYLDQSESKRVLAEGIREAYDDLFRINIKANELSLSDVKNKLRTLTQGKKTDSVIAKMAATFTELCALADWTTIEHPSKQIELPATAVAKKETEQITPKNDSTEGSKKDNKILMEGLHYNIQIHLPESRDPAVYDAIFRSLKEHLI